MRRRMVGGGDPSDLLAILGQPAPVGDKSLILNRYLFIYLFIYLLKHTHTSRTIRQGLQQDSKAQTCTDSYPKITNIRS